jgi:large subunit ribosomal protein L10
VLKSKKIDVVENLRQNLTEANTVILAHYHGLTVTQISQLRRKMLGAGAKFTVTKNTLLKLALPEDSSFRKMEDLFKGPTAIGMSNDPVSVSKVMVEFSEKNENLKILMGVANDNVVTLEGIKVLATLPSIDELRGKIVSILQTSAISIARILTTPATNVARVISAYATKK